MALLRRRLWCFLRGAWNRGWRCRRVKVGGGALGGKRRGFGTGAVALFGGDAGRTGGG